MTTQLTQAIAGYILLNRIYDASAANLPIQSMQEALKVIDECRDKVLAQFDDATDRIAILETSNNARVF